MRLWIFAACAFGLAVSGCFNPHVNNGGFACSSTDPDPCPVGFYCVSGLCQDQPGGGGNGGVGGNGNGSADMSIASLPGDMSSATAKHDLSMHPPDLSHVADLSQAPPDLLQCGAPGTLCFFDSDCCSGSCGFLCD